MFAQSPLYQGHHSERSAHSWMNIGHQAAVLLGDLPFTAACDAVLTHPTLLEGPIPLLSTLDATHTDARRKVEANDLIRKYRPIDDPSCRSTMNTTN